MVDQICGMLCVDLFNGFVPAERQLCVSLNISWQKYFFLGPAVNQSDWCLLSRAATLQLEMRLVPLLDPASPSDALHCTKTHKYKYWNCKYVKYNYKYENIQIHLQISASMLWCSELHQHSAERAYANIKMCICICIIYCICVVSVLSLYFSIEKGSLCRALLSPPAHTNICLSRRGGTAQRSNYEAGAATQCDETQYKICLSRPLYRL